MNNKKSIFNSISRLSYFFLFPVKIFANTAEFFFNSLQSHKNSARLKLSVYPTNFATLVSILPFILGFYEFLNQKYPSERKYLFFEKNIPTLNVPTEKINWETFQYFLKDQNLFFSNETSFSWSDKDFIIQIPAKKSFIISSDQNLMSYINTPLVKEPGGLGSKTLSQQSRLSQYYKLKLNSNSLVSNNLDEFPRKLQSLYTSNPNNILVNFSNVVLTNPVKLASKGYILQEYNLKENFLLGVKTNLFLTKNPFSITNSNTLTNFYKIQQFFDIQIRTLFNTTNLIPNFEGFKKQEVENLFNFSSSKINDFKFLQQVIQEIDKIVAPDPLDLNRLMSGYRYPDMKLKQVIGLFFHGRTTNKRNIQIVVPSSFLIPTILQKHNTQLSSFLIKSKKFVLQNQADQNTNLYEGPSLLSQMKTGYEWEISVLNSSSKKYFREEIEHYLNGTNSLSDSFKNFFGVFDSPENKFNLESKKKSLNANYWLNNLPVFRTGNITNTQPSYFSFERVFQLPYISTQDWNYVLMNQNELSSLNLNTIPLPLLETRIPKKIGPKSLFGSKFSSDFDFLNPFNLLNNTPDSRKLAGKNIQLTFNPSSSTSLNPESFENSLSSGIYKKIPSILDANLSPIFFDLWEPLTFKSWLVTSQIGFAFLVFNVLKALADNYGRELLVYLLDLVALLGFLDDDLKQEIEILMGQREKGFRIISKTTKNFSNVGGIENVLPEIIEIVWFLRNSGREFSISKTLPRGVLLSGPPGTGKTLLVQAIAGEAEVPVLALSGSSLVEPGESGALKLEILFQEARHLAPCIVFIDEMDTLAEKREQVLQNPMGADEILESLATTGKNLVNLNHSNSELGEEIPNGLSAKQDMQKEKLRILMQFLVELDGIQGRDGVVVIGATNRPEMLDAAILRPGRFDRILELGLPGPEKRKEILKLYSNNLGIDKNFSWAYLIHRTAGYSAADLASIMNQSTLNAILSETTHTIETIEYGIDRITTIGIEKPFNTNSNNLSTIQLAYYQAGKILLSALLEYHPPTLVSHLWPRRTNIRALQISKNLQKYFFRFARRIELEHRIIGCYAGKAAEILFLQNSDLLINTSDLGIEDIQFAQNLIKTMTDYWYFYGKTLSLQKNLNILEISNSKEYPGLSEKISFFDSILDSSELAADTTGGHILSSKKMENAIEQQAQKYFATANWQSEISNEFEIATRTFSDWYRLYLPDPQQTERNLEWTPPDEFYHGNSLLDELTDSINWNTLADIHIDYQIHSLILQSFNKAIILLDKNREILDKLAYELINREILRESEINTILNSFEIELKRTPIDLEPLKVQNKQIINPTWGKNSRRPKNRLVNIDLIKTN